MRPKRTAGWRPAWRLGLGLVPTLAGCATDGSVTDVGCALWRAQPVRPSRHDTAATVDAVVALNESMAAACSED